MNDLEKILELAHKNNGFVTTKEVVQNNLNKFSQKWLNFSFPIISHIFIKITPQWFSIIITEQEKSS